MQDVTSEWSRLRYEPALDPQAWELDDITVEPGALTLHDSKHGTWRIAGFPEPQDAVAFMLTGDHLPGHGRRTQRLRAAHRPQTQFVMGGVTC